MNKHESSSDSRLQSLTAAEHTSPFASEHRLLRTCLLAFAVIGLIALTSLTAHAQTPTPSPNPCPTELMSGQKLQPVPVIGSSQGRLRGTIMLSDEEEWMLFRVPGSAPTSGSKTQCMPQHVRMFREFGASPTMASVTSGPYSRGSFALPRPGPTLRARLGDLVQLTFINQINPANFPYSIDRGETGVGGGCDESTAPYPGPAPGGDKYPDCFHGSSTGNLHFHGTHTNPNTTGDNVFIEVRPSLLSNNKPVVTPQSVASSFDKFFKKCEVELSKNVLKEWPTTWSDLPSDYTDEQKKLLKDYDSKLVGPGVRKLWPVDEAQIKQGAWPQYYIGAFPYCFRLPQYPLKTWPPPPPATMQMGGAGSAEMQAESEMNDQPLIMGQSPGTHWYHAHKHGSTAINVANGMTGAFIIEGQYDDDLNKWYGDNWTQTQPVLVINQLGVSPNLMRKPGQGGGPSSGSQDKGPNFSVNGQFQPLIDMKPGEVQMWRIVNTSGRAGAYFIGPPGTPVPQIGTPGTTPGTCPAVKPAKPAGFQWKQLAQDGVQFEETNYQREVKPFVMAAGNRVDLLVKAPAAPCIIQTGCIYDVTVQNEVDPQDLTSACPLTLMSVRILGSPVDPKSNNAQFIPHAPDQPAFLKDIAADKVTGTKKIVFTTGTPGGPPAPAQQTIDGKKFDGEVGEVVLLNTVEEWKIENASLAAISHPFHIHINPFQVVEVFDPNEMITLKTGKQVNKYVFQGGVRLLTGQCYLNPFGNPEDWKPCDRPAPDKPNIWWDVFPIPSARSVTSFNMKTKKSETVTVNGYFKMRSRFVDYPGFYVIHCHILAHEDRGMMTIVEVTPVRTPYSHH